MSDPQVSTAVAPAQFQLEFRKWKFPLRFLLVSLLLLVVTWVAALGADPGAPMNREAAGGHLLLVTVFVLLSLAFLRFFNDVIGQLPAYVGVLVCWGIVCAVALALYLTAYLTLGQSGESLDIPYLRYFNTETTRVLLCMTVLTGLPWFWVERELFSVRGLLQSNALTQFSNLGFRIRPHFLFNSLNSVAHLISLQPARAEKALYNLADVFRVVMADKRELVPMKAELELADKYLYLEKTRLGERLQVASRIDPESLGIMVPVLMLQPLLENAVYHGIETRFKGGTINISVQVVQKQLIIQITNPLPEGSIKRSSGNKVAQENLRDRIDRTFGGRGTFDAHEADERYTVTIRLPL